MECGVSPGAEQIPAGRGHSWQPVPAGRRTGRKEQSREPKPGEEPGPPLTVLAVLLGHDGHALLPHGAHVGAVALAGPDEGGQQQRLRHGAPQHGQHHPRRRRVRLQREEAHHLAGGRGTAPPGQGPEPRGPLRPRSDILAQLVGKKSGRSGEGRVTPDRDRSNVGGRDRMNRGEGTDSEEGRGRVPEQSPGSRGRGAEVVAQET